jgi:hypothetical protein
MMASTQETLLIKIEQKKQKKEGEETEEAEKYLGEKIFAKEL